MKTKTGLVQSSVFVQTQLELEVLPHLFIEHGVEARSVNGGHTRGLVVDNEPDEGRTFTSIDGAIGGILQITIEAVSSVQKGSEHDTAERTVDNRRLEVVLTERQFNVQRLGWGRTGPVPNHIALNRKGGPWLHPIAERIVLFTGEVNAEGSWVDGQLTGEAPAERFEHEPVGLTRVVEERDLRNANGRKVRVVAPFNGEVNNEFSVSREQITRVGWDQTAGFDLDVGVH